MSTGTDEFGTPYDRTEFPMTSLPPENAPQLGTCDCRFHMVPHQRRMECRNWKPVAAPENQPRLSAGTILGHAIQYLNDQSPKNWEAVEIINKAWGEGFREYIFGKNQIGEVPGEVPQPHTFKQPEPSSPEYDPFWQTIWRLHEEWQKVWEGDKEFYSRQYPKWMLDAAAELFAHDMCDAWAWNDYVSAAAVIINRHFGARLDPGAHPPPDERIEYLKKLIHLHFCDEHEGGFYQLSCDARACLICMWDREVEEALSGRARAPHPVSSEEGIDDGVSCEISRTPNIPAGTTGRDDYRDTDRGDNSEAPVAPSKLSAQELAVEIARKLYDLFVIDADEPQDAYEQIETWLTEYASSSNAALQKEVADLRDVRSDAIFFEQRFAQALNWVKTAEAKAAENFRCFEQMEDAYRKSESNVGALEGQLREAQKAHQEAFNIGIDKQKECERLQEALRKLNQAADYAIAMTSSTLKSSQCDIGPVDTLMLKESMEQLMAARWRGDPKV